MYGQASDKDTRRGAALVLAALFCLVLVPIVGVGIDGTTSYLMRLEMSRAIDAAALAGARSLNVGQDIDSQKASAGAVAQKIFNANLSAMNWRMTGVSTTIDVGENNVTHFRWVTVTASADLPLALMGLAGIHKAHISLTATAQRRDVNVMLVLDRSGSMAPAMSSMIAAATDFTNMFAAGRDNLGLVVFTGGTYLAAAPSVNFKTGGNSVTSMIAQLQANNGATNTAQAMWDAYGQLRQLNQPGALNVIVLFTDGLANTYTADFAPYISAAASGCTGLANPLYGVILAFTNGSGIIGFTDPSAQSLNDVTEVRAAPNSAGCFWNADTFNAGQNAWAALTGLPSTDRNGNSTNGTGTMSPYLPVDLSKNGVSSAGIAALNVTNSGQNAFDDAAGRIRGDTTLNPLIYAIGLGGNPGLPPDNVLMARVANDPSSPSFNSSQPPGLYVFSPSTAELHSAFLRIASEILRLAY